MVQVGLTGGIGSGKTLVCGIFEKLGVPVYYADAEAKRLMNFDADLRQEIVDLFGTEAYKGGSVDREFLADRVFGNFDLIAKLNLLVHPAVRKDYLKWVELQTESCYVMEEAAILFESGAHQQMDYTVLVTAPEELRIRRVMQRDQTGRNQVIGRMKHQMSEDEKMKFADYTIYNDEKQMVLPQVIAFHEKILNEG
jgi:dephospho-CoA kinase